MRPYGKLACLLAAIGVGVVPPFASASSGTLLAQSVSPSIYRLSVPPSSGSQLTPSTDPNKSSTNKAKKAQTAESFKKSTQSPSFSKSPVSPGLGKQPPIKYPLTPGLGQQPPVSGGSSNPPESSVETTPSRPVKAKRRKFISLRKPMLACRSFKSNGSIVRGFRVKLYGRNSASSLKSRLEPYQAAGGSLARCIYSGIVPPSDFSKYFKDRKPSGLIRSADNYRLPLYSSYSELFAASGGRRARFGLIASSLPIQTSSGRKDALRIAANNALILFIDGRNQSLFRASPSRLPLRLIAVSPDVREVLSGASKTSLRRIIDYKKLKKIPLQQSSPSSSLNPGSRFGLPLSALAFSGPQPLSLFAGSFVAEPYSALLLALPKIDVPHESLIAEVDPQIAEYCMKAQDFSGCVETMQGSTGPAFPGAGGGSGAVTEDGSNEPGSGSEPDVSLDSESECPEGASSESGQGDCLPDDLVLANPEGGSESEEEGGMPGNPDGESAASDDEADYHNGTGMYPEDMGAPTAQACTGQTFGEQLACALISALTSMMQQAFSAK